MAQQVDFAAPAVAGHVVETQRAPGQVELGAGAQFQVLLRGQAQLAAGQADAGVQQQAGALQGQFGAQCTIGQFDRGGCRAVAPALTRNAPPASRLLREPASPVSKGVIRLRSPPLYA